MVLIRWLSDKENSTRARDGIMDTRAGAAEANRLTLWWFRRRGDGGTLGVLVPAVFLPVDEGALTVINVLLRWDEQATMGGEVGGI